METKSPAISRILTGCLTVLIVSGIFLEISNWEKWVLTIPVILGTGFLLFFEKKYLIYLTVFLIPFSFSYQLGEGVTLTLPAEILIVVLAAVFLIYLLLNPQLFTHELWSHPVSIWIYMDLALGLLAVMNSEIPLVSLKRWVAKLIFVAVFFFMLGIWFSRKEMYQKVLLLWGLGLGGIVLFTLFQHSQYRMGIPYAPAMSRPFFDDHTIYGANLAMFVPLMGLLWLNRNQTGLSSTGKWFLSGLLLLFLTGIFFSFSRAVWLSLAIVLFLGGMIKLVNIIKWSRSRIIMGMGLTMIVVVLGVMMTGNWIKSNR
ncbi:MAG: hypothetical protein KDD63_14565, partial [Bacteroidetes bacterium]|nr:hypothetical protein [Bacteroidota bacterium]